MADENDQRPTPDPTRLTTDQLDRAEERMRREVESATKLLQADMTGYERHCTEQFTSVKTELQLIERQRVEQKADTEKAVQAALSAAKEAVREQTAASEKAIAKSETAISEQLKQLNATFTTAIEAAGATTNDLKERIGKVEQGEAGSRGAALSTREAKGASQTLVIAMVGVFATLFVSFIIIIANVLTGA